ncbi:MAG: serine hydrolase domain-containing protein, partial [Saprospiraceae bacterium]
MNALKNVFPLLLGLLLLFSLPTVAQKKLSSEHRAAIDKLFENWQDSSHPGVVMAMLQNDEVVYQEAYGAADLASGAPNTLATKFNMGGLSKSFVAYAILQLEQQGKLQLNQDIRQHLPQLPQYDQVVTINHLLNHCSGISDFFNLKYLAGWRINDQLTHAEALQFISQQQKLDYQPGTAFNVSRSNITLLVEIIQNVTEQTFEEYCKANIFEPLQMNTTEFVRNTDQIVENGAVAYQNDEGTFHRNMPTLGTIGLTNLYTNVNDYTKWIQHLDHPKSNTALIKKFKQPAKNDLGKTFTPPNGTLTVGQEYLHSERGMDNVFWQYGRIGGYACGYFRFEDGDVSTFVMGNSGMGYNAYLAIMSAYVLLEDQFSEAAVFDFASMPKIDIPSAKLDTYCGNYWDHLAATSRRVYVENDTLWYARPEQNYRSALLPIDQHTFRMYSEGDEKILVRFDENAGQQQMTYLFSHSDEI